MSPTPVVTEARIELPVVYYRCPGCDSPRETSIGRWERGETLACRHCETTYRLRTPRLTIGEQ